MSGSKPAGQGPHGVGVWGVVRSVDADEDGGWAARALCRDTDPDRLFVTGAEQRKAAVICRHCVVMQECAAEALDNRVAHGVWGGMTERERRALIQRHPEVVSWSNFFRTGGNRSAG
ncbi:WhiB4 [Mycobacterium bohemicum DSM 44277]|uniref:Transcriptional regulator WhiB n=2 Tax=Mycobacterium bohemicum TaxID=56425 RepID=A0A1X1RB22_MYCBE|nr:WhiB family transcriptional regulator [Mycobacterium bohemicum]MCV6968667.1 WhiB family transcriptional regulator [Mycobacterium bohemicum]ORV02412.1 transcriptional regulator [Mycobacterium bohemicum]CPR13016.1 WhiB4 [Mycobacterium bohemicum DSM 44277]